MKETMRTMFNDYDYVKDCRQWEKRHGKAVYHNLTESRPKWIYYD